MARKFSVEAVLSAKDNASKGFKSATASVGAFSKALAVGLVAAAAAAALAIKKSLDIARQATDAYSKQEDAVNALEASLIRLGPKLEAVSKAAQEQAAGLSKLTRFGDEAIISAQAFLSTLGVEAKLLPQATQATVDLAAALGISLESAARNVGKTVGGFAGELGEVIPELKDLSVEALRAGAGIELLADQFAGRAQADAKSFSGATAQLRNQLGDLFETVGAVIAQSDKLQRSFAAISKTLTSDGAIKSAEAFGVALSKIVDATAAAASAAASLGSRLGALADEYRKLKKEASEYGNASDFNRKFDEALAQQFGVLGPLMLRLARRYSALKAAAAAAATATRDLTKEERDSVKNLSTLEAALGDATKAEELYTKLKERELRLEKSLNDARGTAAGALTELGIVTNTDLRAALEAEAVSLEAVQELFRQGEIDVRRFKKAQEESSITIAALEAVLSGEVATVGEYRSKLDAAATSTDGLATSTDSLAVAQQNLASGLADTQRQLEKTKTQALLTGAEFDRLERSAGRAVAVAAAAARAGGLSLGGTRVAIAGGSRLASEPGFSKVARNPHTGLLTPPLADRNAG